MWLEFVKTNEKKEIEEYLLTKEQVLKYYPPNTVLSPDYFGNEDKLIFFVEPVQPPKIKPLQKLVKTTPIYKNEAFFQNYEVIEMNESERQICLDSEWTQIREKRNLLLKETDWVVLRSLEKKDIVPEKWANYRQALRDITKNEDPFAVIWPTKPD